MTGGRTGEVDQVRALSDLKCSVNDPHGDAHLSMNDVTKTTVLSDEQCLYCSAVALCDMQGWRSTRSTKSNAKSLPQKTLDAAGTAQMRQAVIQAGRSEGLE